MISLIIEQGYEPNNFDVFYTVLYAEPNVLRYLLHTKYLYYIDFTLDTELKTLFDILDYRRGRSLFKINTQLKGPKIHMLNINVLSLIVPYVEHLESKYEYNDKINKRLISNFEMLLSFGMPIEDFGYNDVICYDLGSKIREREFIPNIF